MAVALMNCQVQKMTVMRTARSPMTKFRGDSAPPVTPGPAETPALSLRKPSLHGHHLSKPGEPSAPLISFMNSWTLQIEGQMGQVGDCREQVILA